METLFYKNMMTDFMQSDVKGIYFNSDGYFCGLHDHDFYEIVLVLKGEFMHLKNGKEEYPSEGTLMFIRPGDVHDIIPIDGKPFIFVNMGIQASTIDLLVQYLGPSFGFYRLKDSVMPPQCRLSKSQVFTLNNDFQPFTFAPDIDMACHNYMWRVVLLNTLVRYFPNQKNTPCFTNINAWLDWIYHELRKPENFTASPKGLFNNIGYSYEHISREFKKRFGITISKYRTNLRLEYAHNLLQFSDDKILDIAMDSGFSNLSNFMHLFKRKYGTSPSEVRKKQQNNTTIFQ